MKEIVNTCRLFFDLCKLHNLDIQPYSVKLVIFQNYMTSTPFFKFQSRSARICFKFFCDLEIAFCKKVTWFINNIKIT
jgi:hypothetical protein